MAAGPAEPVFAEAPTFSFANTYVLVVERENPPAPNPPNSNADRYVYKISVENPSEMIIDPLIDPNSFSITVDRYENIYVADKVDRSILPMVMTVPENDPYYVQPIGNTALELLEACIDYTRSFITDYVRQHYASGDFTGEDAEGIFEDYPTFTIAEKEDNGVVIYKGGKEQFIWHPAGPLTGYPDYVLPYPVLFHRPAEYMVDRFASWHGHAGWGHDYDYHMTALNKQNAEAHIDLDGSGDIGDQEKFETHIDYPLTFIMTSEADDTCYSANDRTTGMDAGQYAEPFNQVPHDTCWIPNGAWYHWNHCEENSEAGRDRARIVRGAYMLTTVFGHLHQWLSETGYADPDANNPLEDLIIWEVSDTRWSLRQCGDPCANTAQGQLSGGAAFKENPFQLLVGPSGRMYLFSPYDKDSILRYKEKNPDGVGYTEWMTYDLSPDGPFADSTINVDCPYENGQYTVRFIGLATYSLTTDWVYMSSSNEFTVGDQFDGKGGVMYFRLDDKIQQIDENVKNYTVKDLDGAPWEPDSEQVMLPASVEITSGTNMSADGLGNLYFIAETLGEWEYKEPIGEWITVPDMDIVQRRRVLFDRDIQLKLWIYPRRGGTIYEPPGATYSGQKQYTEGWEYQDNPDDDIPVNDPPPMEYDEPDPESKTLHVDLATVNDATPPIDGKCLVDITPVNTAKGQFEMHDSGTDVIYLEDTGDKVTADGGPYFKAVWEFENWKTDYEVKEHWEDHEAVLPDVNEIVSGEPVPYNTAPWVSNPLHFNFLNQKVYLQDPPPGMVSDPNTNGIVGGWSSNMLGDTEVGPGNPTANAHDSREYQWSVWLIATEDEVFEQPKQVYPQPDECLLPTHEDFFVPHDLSDGNGTVAHADHHEGGGYRFSYVFKDSGVYEVRLQARCHIYDYRHAGVMPEFLRNPDEHIDTDGGQEAYCDAVAIKGVGSGGEESHESDPGTEYVRYYCRAKAHPLHYEGPLASYPIIATRRVVVGAKLPDYGAWAMLKLFTRKEDRPNAVSTNTSFFPKMADEELVDFEIDEDQLMETQAVAAVKYYKDIDEKTVLEHITGRKDPITGAILDVNDLKGRIHDQFSGVVPGSVRFVWSFYNTAEAIEVETAGSNDDPAPEFTGEVKVPNDVLSRPWSQQSEITRDDCSNLHNEIKFSFDTRVNSGLCGSSLLDGMQNLYTGSSEDINLTYQQEDPGRGVSSGQYVPDWSNIVLFYYDTQSDFMPPAGSSPGLENPDALYLPGKGMRQFINYPTPSVGRPEDCLSEVFDEAGDYGNKADCYRVKVQLWADVQEFQATEGGDDDPFTRLFNANNAWTVDGDDEVLTAEGAKLLAMAFSPVLHPDQLLCEKIFDVKVYDTTAPAVFLAAENTDQGVTTGDLYSNSIVLSVMDNNPYTAPGGPMDEQPGLEGTLWESKKFEARLLYTIVPDEKDIDQTSDQLENDLLWGDLPSAENEWCDVVDRFANDLIPEALEPGDYKTMMHSPVGVTYEFTADQWRINPDGGCPPGALPEPQTTGSTRAGTIVLYAVATDSSGNGLMTMMGGTAEGNVPALRNNEEGETMGAGHTFYGPDYEEAKNIGDAGEARSRRYSAGDSYARLNMDIRDNDPPEIYFTIEDRYGETVFVTCDDHQVLQVGRTKDEAGGDTEIERVAIPEFNPIEDWVKWPGALLDETNPDGTVVSHAIAPGQAGSIGPFGLACLVKGAGEEYVWRFPLDGVPLANQNDSRFIWDLYYRGDPEPIISGSSVEHSSWFVDFRDTEKNEGIMIVAPPNEYTVDNVQLASASGEMKYFGLPEDTRITFRLRAEDNVDGPFTSFIAHGEGRNYSISLLGADELFNLDNAENLSLYKEDEAAEMKEFCFYQIYHHPSPEGDEAIKTMVLKVWDRAGNARALRIPLKVVNTNVRVHALESFLYDRKSHFTPTNK